MPTPAHQSKSRRGATVVLLMMAALFAFMPYPARPSAAASQAQSSALPQHEAIPGAGETYPGSGAYLVGGSDAMNAAIQTDQKAMTDKQIDVGRLVGLRLGDVIFTLKSGKGKRLAFFERGAYHELDGNVALGSLVLTSLKDGKIVLGTPSTDPDDYYALTPPQRDYLLSQPVAGEGGQTALTFEGLLDAGVFGASSLPILNTDPNKASDVTSKYEGKLITQGMGYTIQVQDLNDPNFQQEMLLPSPATSMRMPKGAYNALLRTFNGDPVAVLKLVGYPVSPYFVMETQLKGVPKKVGVIFTERQVLTYNPDNNEANRWEIGLFGARVFGAMKGAAGPAPTPMPTLAR